MNSHVYMRSDSDGSRHAVLLGLLAAAGLFLLIPFSQMMSGSPETLLRPAPKVFVQTPPDIILIDEPILDEVVVDIEVAAFEPEVLETSLSDFGGSLTLGKGWAVLPDLKSEYVLSEKDFYSFAELDRVPDYLSGKPLGYPNEMRRNKVSGSVMLLVMIDEQGRVSVEKVIDSTHAGFERAAIEFAEASKFESPRKNGEIVKAQFKMPVKFDLRE